MADWFNAHRKVVAAALTSLLLVFIDQGTVDIIVAVVGVILTGVVPNDQAAIERVYKKEPK